MAFQQIFLSTRVENVWKYWATTRRNENICLTLEKKHKFSLLTFKYLINKIPRYYLYWGTSKDIYNVNYIKEVMFIMLSRSYESEHETNYYYVKAKLKNSEPLTLST